MGNCTPKKHKQEVSTDHSNNAQIKTTNASSNDVQVPKLDNGQTINYKGIKIFKNPQTGKLEGVPKQWVQQYNIPFQIDYSKMVSTKNFPSQIQTSQQLPQTILKILSQNQITFEKTQLSIKNQNPRAMQQQIFLEPAPQQPYGIRGLTDQLKNVLQYSKISPNEAKKNPLPLIQMLNSYHDQVISKNVGRHNRLMTMKDFENKMDNVVFLEKNPSREYVFDRQLGKGATCKVFVAYSKKDHSKVYAVRIMKVKQQRKIQKIKREIAVMQLCGANNIVNYNFSYYYKNLLFMFVEFMNQGCLTDFIFQYIQRIPQDIIAFILRQILIGLGALHCRRQIHRDLKSDNILINSAGQIKIADFGFAIQLTKQRDNRVSLVGTPAWMAPQLIQKQKYDESVDIWSLGMVAMELCNGEPPFLEQQQFRTMYLIVSSDPPALKTYSSSMKDFVKCCLQKNPKKRLSSFQLLNHPLIKSIGDGTKQKFKFQKMLRDRINLSTKG